MAAVRYGTTCGSTRGLRGLVTRDFQAMAAKPAAAEQDDHITYDEASFPLNFAPKAIASVIVEVSIRGDDVRGCV